jgi:hypothetical protein
VRRTSDIIRSRLAPSGSALSGIELDTALLTIIGCASSQTISNRNEGRITFSATFAP